MNQNGRREREILAKIDDVASVLAKNQSAMQANQITMHNNQASLKASAEDNATNVESFKLKLSQLADTVSTIKDTLCQRQHLPSPPVSMPTSVVKGGPIVRDTESKKQGAWGCS